MATLVKQSMQLHQAILKISDLVVKQSIVYKCSYNVATCSQYNKQTFIATIIFLYYRYTYFTASPHKIT